MILTKYGMPIKDYQRIMWKRCPTCRSEPGTRCANKWGETLHRPHKARRDLAKKKEDA